jgi:hypothetical protein
MIIATVASIAAPFAKQLILHGNTFNLETRCIVEYLDAVLSEYIKLSYWLESAMVWEHIYSLVVHMMWD